MSEFKRDVSFNSAENQARDVVLGFIHDKDDKRVGMRVWNRATNTTHTHRIPEVSWQAWNLNIHAGRLDPKCCNLTEFPVLSAKGNENPLALGVKLVSKNSGAWVLGEYPDGRLRLISVAGQLKDVTKETALGFANQFKIANAEIGASGLTPKAGEQFTPIVAKSVEALSRGLELTQEDKVKDFLLNVMYEVLSKLTPKRFDASDFDGKMGNLYSYLTITLRSEAYYKMSMLDASMDLLRKLESLGERINKAYNLKFDLSGEIGVNGYYTVTLGVDTPKTIPEPKKR